MLKYIHYSKLGGERMRYDEDRAVVELDVDEFCERTSGFGSL